MKTRCDWGRFGSAQYNLQCLSMSESGFENLQEALTHRISRQAKGRKISK